MTSVAGRTPETPALRLFRNGLEEEFAEYDRRERELKELKGE